MGNTCSKYCRRNRNYPVSSSQNVPVLQSTVKHDGGDSRSLPTESKTCQVKMTKSENTYTFQGQTPSSSAISPIDCRSARPSHGGKAPISSVHSKDNGTASEPLDHEHHIITQSGSESTQMSPTTDHEDHPLAIHNSSHQEEDIHLKDEAVPTTVSGEASVALNASSQCTCSENNYELLIRYNDKLVTALKSDTLSIANTLFAKGFIPEATQEEIQRNITPQQKATILVTTMRDKIKIAPKRYNELLGILSQQECRRDILDILPFSNCELHKFDLERDIEDHCLVSKTAEAIHVFGSDHSSSNEECIFPELNSDDEIDLEAQLSLDADDMRTKFAALQFDTAESFHRQGLRPKQLVSAVLGLTEYDDPSIGKPLLKREKKKLANAQDIHAVFDILRSHMTFFNYEILGFLIERLGSEEDKRALQIYLHHFRQFCRRSVFEVPMHVLGHSSEKVMGQKRLHVLITEVFKAALLARKKSLTESESSVKKICAPKLGISLNNAKYIQRKVAAVIKVKPSTLYLDLASPGSTVLTFLLPEHVSLAGLDSDPEIIVLLSNGIHILCGPPGKPEPKELTSRGLVVQWSQPEYGRPSLAKYILYYQKKYSEAKPMSEWQKLELSSLETHTCVPDLRDGDTYVFKICAMSDAGTLQYSDESGPITLAIELTDPQQEFVSAVKCGDKEKVRSLLQNTEIDIDIDLPDENGCTPLFIAIEEGFPEIAEILINEKKADVNTRDNNGKTLLMAAVIAEKLELVKMCLEVLDAQDDVVNIQEKQFGQSALHFAVRKGKVDIVERLMDPDLRANVNLRDKEGKSPIDLAEGNSEILKILSEARIDSSIELPEDEEQYTAEQRAKKGSKILLPWIKSDLIQAVMKGSREEVEKLLRENVDPDQSDYFNWTPLMYSSQKGDVDITRLLLQHEVDPNKQSDGEGWTALILASHRGHVEVVDQLLSDRLKIKCKVNQPTKRRNMTALQRACLGYRPTVWSVIRRRTREEEPEENREGVVKRLLDSGADVTIVDSQKRTPLIAASKCRYHKIVEILLEYLKNNFSEDERKGILDQGMNGGWTALMEASQEGHTKIIKLLLEAGAAANKTKKDLDTALHVAAYHGHIGVVELLLQYMNAQDVNLQNDDGMTPLMLAAKRKKAEVVKLLLEAGGDTNIQSNNRRTALEYARRAGRGATDITNTLEEWARSHPQIA